MLSENPLTARLQLPVPPEDFRVVCIDFDGTVATRVWPDPSIGAAIPEGLNMIRYYKEMGCEVILHTGRPWQDAPLIYRWLKAHEASVDFIQCGKPVAALYVDDRAYRVPWSEVTL